MRKLKKITNRFAAAALAAVMLTAQLPVNAFAAKNVEQEIAEETVATQEMTAASETADIPESKPSTEVPEQTEGRDEAETPEQTENKDESEAPDPLLLLSSFFMI